MRAFIGGAQPVHRARECQWQPRGGDHWGRNSTALGPHRSPGMATTTIRSDLKTTRVFVDTRDQVADKFPICTWNATGLSKEGTYGRGWLSYQSRALRGTREAKRPRMAVAMGAAATAIVAIFLCMTEAAGRLWATAEGESPIQEPRRGLRVPRVCGKSAVCQWVGFVYLLGFCVALDTDPKTLRIWQLEREGGRARNCAQWKMGVDVTDLLDAVGMRC